MGLPQKPGFHPGAGDDRLADSDGDGLYDPLDTTPSLALTAYSPDPATTAWPQYAGSTQDVPYNSPTRSDATINTITAVQYRVDGGTWQECAPADGAFNTWQEGFTCAVGPLSEGPHTIQSRSHNSVNAYSATAADTLTIDTVAPLNPLTVTPGCAATSNIWQNSCGKPAFTWSGPAMPPAGWPVISFIGHQCHRHGHYLADHCRL